MGVKLLKNVFLFICLSGLFVILYQLSKNALNSLPKGKKIIESIESKKYISDSRLFKEFSILDSNLGEINIAVSFPMNIDNKPLPVLFIIGGVETGLESIKHISDIGNNIVVGYDWPINNESIKAKSILYNIFNLYSSVNKSPGQIATALEWIHNQPWSENRISLLGFSIGAIAAPAVQHIVESRNIVDIKWTVLAYGGTNIGKLVNSNPFIKPSWLKPFLGWIVQILFNSVDPKEHLEKISGNFLIINGKNDDLIPKYSSLKLQNLTPHPKKIILLDGNHMGVGEEQKELLKIIIKKTRSWLKINKAINTNI